MNECVAYHEAGHAVVALRLGFEVGKVSIVRRGGGGSAEVRRRSPIPSPDDIKVDMAGPLAEALVNFEDAEVQFGARVDQQDTRRRARDLIMLGFIHGRDKDILIKELVRETRALVRRDKEAIVRVAAALLEHGTLSGDEVKQIVEAVP